MTSSNFMASTAVLVLLLISSAKGDFLSPFFSPSMDICNDVNCGKGNCTMDSGSLFGFSCECDNGWKRTTFDNETKFKFLPCIIPNCSINYSCMPAAPPAPAMAPLPLNPSTFDPCYSIYCGEGTCTKTSTYSYTCQCDSGSNNLLNSSVLPCYSNNCSLGSDCQKLGIGVSTSTPSTPGSQAMAANPSQPPAPSLNNAATPRQPPAPSLNNATALLPGKFHWIAIICVLMISSINLMVQWK